MKKDLQQVGMEIEALIRENGLCGHFMVCNSTQDVYRNIMEADWNAITMHSPGHPDAKYFPFRIKTTDMKTKEEKEQKLSATINLLEFIRMESARAFKYADAALQSLRDNGIEWDTETTRISNDEVT